MLRSQIAIYQLICIFYLILTTSAQSQDISLSEIRNTADAERAVVLTGHLIYIEDENNNRPVKRESFMDDKMLNQIKSHQNKHRKINTIIDMKGRNIKTIITDLRNLNNLMKDFNLPEYSVSESKSYLFKENIEMYLPSIPITGQKPEVDLIEPPGNKITFQMLSLGVIDNHDILDNVSVLSTIKKDSSELLRLTTTVTRDRVTYVTAIDCDPLLGYRFRHIELRVNGRLANETIADRYTDINGIPYPFAFTYRAFDKNGALKYERTLTFEKVELNIPVSPDDYKILLPPDVKVNDSVVYKGFYDLKDGGYKGIDDIVELSTHKTLSEH